MALCSGDPAGVGPEIIQHWLSRNETFSDCPLVAIGPRQWVNGLAVEGESVGPEDYCARPGQPDEAGAKIAWRAMELAAQGCRDGRFGGVVTGPVSKKALAAVGYPFPGQTEFFAESWGGVPTMGFVGERMRVVLASWHLPLREVPDFLETNPLSIERAIDRAVELCVKLGHSSPTIAVCGINPHAGEEGILGTEERRWLDPLLDCVRDRHPGLSRALPSDTVFHRHLRGEFDVVVAMYHDQGLAPLKALEFDRAVNITLGLPWVRTSPDHGTAFAIAGKGLADTGSWDAAVRLAARMVPRPGMKSSHGGPPP